MGLLGAVGAGLAEAGGAGAKIGMEQIRAAIEADRDARLNDMKLATDQTLSDRRWQEEQTRAPDKNRMAADAATSKRQAELDVEFDPKNIDAKIASMQTLGPAEAKIKTDAAVADLIAKSSPEAIGAARKIAAATRDPLQQKLLNAQIAKAQLDLDEGAAQAGERGQVRGLIGAAASVDKGQPGAAEAEKFYTDEAKKAEKGAQLVKGVDVDKADRSAYLALAKEKYEMANKEMDPDRKARYEREGDEYAQAAMPKPAGGGTGGPPPASDRVAGKVYATPKGDMEWTGAGWKPAGTAKPAATASAKPAQAKQAASAEPEIVSLEPAGTTLIGGKRFVAKYSDGTTRLVSGDDVERKAILMSK